MSGVSLPLDSMCDRSEPVQNPSRAKAGCVRWSAESAVYGQYMSISSTARAQDAKRSRILDRFSEKGGQQELRFDLLTAIVGTQERIGIAEEITGGRVAG